MQHSTFVTLYEHERNPVPKSQGRTSIRALAEKSKTHQVRSTKSGKAWAPHELAPGTARKNENVVAIHALVLDFDAGIPFGDIAHLFAGLEYIAHSSYSNTPETPKYRVVVALSRPVSANEWPTFYPLAVARFGEAKPDPACSDLARLYFRPSCPESGLQHAWSQYQEGAALDVDALLASAALLRDNPPSDRAHAAALGGGNLAPAKIEHAPSDAARVAKRCPQIGAFKRGEEQAEPLWKAALTVVARCEGGQQLAHVWSQQDERYDPAETQSKIDRSSGPATCDQFRTLNPDGCAGCVHTCRSPIQLGEAGALAVQDEQGEPERVMPIYETLNDAGNADRFIAEYGKVVRYVPEMRQWLIRHEGRWKSDKKANIMQLAVRVARSLFDLAREQADSAAAKAVSAHASRTLQQSRLEAMIALAATSPKVTVSVQELDADDFILGVQNGVICLKKGTFEPNRPELLVTQYCSVAYDPQADCPIWRATLARVFAGNKDLIDFFQRSAGYSLTGDTREQKFFFCHGSGANGKSTLLNAIREILGSYAAQISPEVLMVQRAANSGNATPELVRLQGKRFVAATETEDGSRLREAFVKQVTGGEPFEARALYGSPFEIVPHFKFWLSGNHKPIIRGEDFGIWRRILLLLFGVTIAPDEIDRALSHKLRGEYPGILNWLIHGALEWQRHGLNPPREIVREVEAYRSDMDVLAAWIDEACTIEPSGEFPSRAAYSSYSAWCHAGGHQVCTEVRFGQRMLERGFSRKKTKLGARYVGVTARQGSLFR